MKRYLPLLLITLAAALLRLALWAQPLHQPANDEIEYLAVAQDLLAGRGWVFYDSWRWLRAPLYPLWLAASLWLANGDLLRAALPNILLSSLNVALIGIFAEKVCGPRACIPAALISALLWTNATFASLYMAETLFSFLLLIHMLALLQAVQRASYAWIILAGISFGLAALTRSALLPFLPLAMAWLAWQIPTHTWRERLFAPALLALLALLVIAPWTIRNTLAYGKPILIETGLSYNLWAFNEPREDLSTINRTLEAIPNPVERSEFATAQGMQRLHEDPAILWRKLWPNWIFLSRVKPIQDRFLMENYYASVDLPLFAAAIIFDDLLYLAIASLAVVGLAACLAPPRFTTPAMHLLTLGWLATSIAIMLLTHGESRYRHFLFPLLIPYAGFVLGHWHQIRFRSPPILASIALSLWVCWSIISFYPFEWASQNLARGWHTFVGDAAMATGQPQAAIPAYQQAAAAQKVPDPLLRLGLAHRAAGDPEAALSAFRAARRLIPIYEPTAARLGDLLRAERRPEEARAAFDTGYLDPTFLLNWSWRELEPPPISDLEVGDGLDYGYIHGVYPAEELAGSLARWSGSTTQIRLGPPDGSGPDHQIILRMAAPHPSNQPVTIRICASTCHPLTITPTWRIYRVPIILNGQQPITITSPTFAASDGRTLGILIDTIRIR
ncbi:MAG: tetratricopeptide repeat protein [Roseiflexaceae bacterium]